MNCWHRAGRMSPSGKVRTCRHFGVAVQECPCVDWSRSPKSDCPCCSGSGFVAIVRGKLAKFADYVENRL